MPQIGRRNALKLLSGSFVLASFPWTETASGEGSSDKSAADGTLALLFDGSLRTQVLFRGRALTPFQSSEALLLGERRLEAVPFTGNSHEDLKDPRHGSGRR